MSKRKRLMVKQGITVLVSNARYFLHEHVMKEGHFYTWNDVVDHLPMGPAGVEWKWYFATTEVANRYHLAHQMEGLTTPEQWRSAGYRVISTGNPEWPYIVFPACNTMTAPSTWPTKRE